MSYSDYFIVIFVAVILSVGTVTVYKFMRKK